MPFLSTDDGYLRVFNIFDADSQEKQDGLLAAMKDIIDNADYPGWVSSTAHRGMDRFGVANIVQWESREQLEARYAGEAFQHRTVPEFNALATRVQLLQAEVVFSQAHPKTPSPVEVSPERDDYTVLIVLESEPENQKDLVDTMAQPDEWLLDVPGYRSHTIMRGINGSFLVNYAQWDSKELYDAFHTLPEEERPDYVRRTRTRARSLATSRWANTFRVAHSRSAGEGQ
ncbi:antibiotic biosynthesis monooxygenase family protein [Streptomyces daliensis]|uniref:Antibiotic biosynthesis monooxygenase n=1 Tax=Streptomyces daliensis TaxID=299421 RepID=A0A8T4IUF0_9ACTN|nr:antibiotic biosynthesis monooxygenase [Streptomyces daliensis]